MKRWGWLAAAVLLPRVVVLFVNQNLAGDAIARTWLAHRWLEAPHLITHFGDGAKQFGPLHLYLLAFAEWAWPSLLHAGRVTSLVVGALTAWPLFALTARRFGERAATYAVLAFAFWGLHVQSSTIAASEALNLLLVMGAVALFDLGPERRGAEWGAALLLNLACATRYDSWLLVPLLALGQWQRTGRLGAGVRFGALSSVFALSWLVGNQLGVGSALYPVRFIDQYHRAWWAQEAAGWGEGLYRAMCLFFWPGSAVATLTPAVALAGGFMSVRAWRERPELRWLVVLIVAPAVLYSVRGAAMSSFAPMARFTMKELLLLLPFAGWGLHRLEQRHASWARGSMVFAAAWCVGVGVYSFRPDTKVEYSLRSIAATSRLEAPLREDVSWLQDAVAGAPGLLLVDEDPTGFDDLPLSYFSGLSFDEQLRRRYERYVETLRDRSPRWLALFEGGRMTRSGEVTLAPDGAAEFRGARYGLRHPGRIAIYERLTPPASAPVSPPGPSGAPETPASTAPSPRAASPRRPPI